MYPSYKLRDALDEYAIAFFALLNEGYKQRYRHYQIMAQISDLPQMEQKDREAFYRNLNWATADPDDILKPRTQSSSPDQIKKILRGI